MYTSIWIKIIPLILLYCILLYCYTDMNHSLVHPATYLLTPCLSISQSCELKVLKARPVLSYTSILKS